jgi:tellurite resistance protein TerC
MHVSLWVWTVTLLGLAAMLAIDLLVIGRRPREPSMRESTLWVCLYVALAALFGAMVWLGYGPRYGGEFFAGWLTEYSLSVDNLFVFVIILARFRTPRIYQQKALLIGIVLALVMRGGFIALGSAALAQFDWIFYFFGIFLIYTAVALARHGMIDESDYQDNLLIKWTRRILPVSSGYHGTRLFTRVGSRRMVTPMLIVMVALATTDLVFALDSIPAIFGLTKEGYLVFTANVFALMGLRQLYFLLGGLLHRLVYLSVGLAVVLGFIGVKLVLEALHDNNLPFLNGGDPVPWAPRIPIWLSLTVIAGTLTVAVLASVARSAAGRLRGGAEIRTAVPDEEPAGD